MTTVRREQAEPPTVTAVARELQLREFVKDPLPLVWRDPDAGSSFTGSVRRDSEWNCDSTRNCSRFAWALGARVGLRENTHAPESPQQNERGTPRTDAGQLHKPRERFGRGELIDGLRRERAGGNRPRGRVQRVGLLPAHAAALEGQCAGLRDGSGAREGEMDRPRPRR